jgi:hypothetical protein
LKRDFSVPVTITRINSRTTSTVAEKLHLSQAEAGEMGTANMYVT